MGNGRPSRPGFSSGFSAATTCRLRSSIPRPAVVAMGCIPIVPMKTAAASRSCPICWRLRKCASLRASMSTRRTPWRFAPSARQVRRLLTQTRTGDTLLQATFLNRRALYLRPDPARVIVRPFKPTTEPRDLNPTDKTRANHIVERVLISIRTPRPANWLRCSRIFRVGTATCWRGSSAGPTKWRRRCSRTAWRFPKFSASSSAPIPA